MWFDFRIIWKIALTLQFYHYSNMLTCTSATANCIHRNLIWHLLIFFPENFNGEPNQTEPNRTKLETNRNRELWKFSVVSNDKTAAVENFHIKCKQTKWAIRSVVIIGNASIFRIFQVPFLSRFCFGWAVQYLRFLSFCFVYIFVKSWRYSTI